MPKYFNAEKKIDKLHVEYDKVPILKTKIITRKCCISSGSRNYKVWHFLDLKFDVSSLKKSMFQCHQQTWDILHIWVEQMYFTKTE